MPKDDVRFEAYGTVDEFNAVLGLVRAHGLDVQPTNWPLNFRTSCSSLVRPSPTLRLWPIP